MSEQQRLRLVDDLEKASAIETPEVRDAFLAVPRAIFISEVVEEKGVEAAYLDEAYPTKTDDRGDPISSSSQPQIMALMLEALNVRPGHRVLEIGTGTGYNAALLSNLAGREGQVTSIELDSDLAGDAERNLRRAGQVVDVVVGDGREGWPAGAPYDRTIVTASSLDVPKSFLDQLKEGGLLVLPLRITDSLPFQQIVVTLQRMGGELTSISAIRGGFMRLRDRPDDPSLPWPSSDLVDTHDGQGQTVGSLSGAAWGGLADRTRERLSALCLERPRSLPFGMRVRSWQQWELQTFIALSVDEELLVGIVRENLQELSFLGTQLPAVIERDGRGLAHLAGDKTVSRIEAFGEPGPDRILRSVVDEWRHRGRAAVARLRLRVTYGRSTSGAWRYRKRGQSLIEFNW